MTITKKKFYIYVQTHLPKRFLYLELEGVIIRCKERRKLCIIINYMHIGKSENYFEYKPNDNFNQWSKSRIAQQIDTQIDNN